MIKKIIFILFFLCVTNATYASCSFTRDLEVGDEGDDVKCLQEYLNKSGYTIASKGVGSVGRETKTFKDLTKEAVKKWQKSNGVTPVTGFFGSVSRRVYTKLITGESSNTTTTKPTTSSDSLKSFLSQVLDELFRAEEKVKDASSDTQDAEEGLSHARDYLIKAFRAYIDGDSTKARSYANDVFSYAQSAYESVGGDTGKDKVNERLSLAIKALNRTKDKIDNAERNGDDVYDAKNIVDSIDDLVVQVRKNVRNDLYVKANTILQNIENKIEDAQTAISDSHDDKGDALSAIEEAKKALSNAKEEFKKADSRHGDTGNAGSIIESAGSLLDKARMYFDDSQYKDAISFAKKSEQKSDDALDEF